MDCQWELWLKVDGAYLYEEPGCDERQTAVLPIKSVMVSVEGKVIQIEEPETRKKMLPRIT